MVLRILGAALVFVLLSGCENKNGPVPVTGTVKYEDGSVPTGEIADVRFENAAGGAAGKMARGVIGPDGRFKLTTMDPDDGAFPADYKVVFEIFQTYMGRESLVAPEFEKIATTPLAVTVKRGEKNDFDFVVKKRQ